MGKNYILFTGLVRDEQVFYSKLKKCENLIEKGVIEGVIFSTWVSEMEKYNNISIMLKKIKAIIIESDEPNIIIPGHVVHQMKALYLGLNFLTDQDYVYKMRPDLGIFNIEKVIGVFSKKHDTKINDSEGWPRIFDERIVIENGWVLFPFYINDTQYFGKNKDLKKMINFDFSFEIFFNDLAPEQLFFFTPFFNDFKIFSDYFRVNQRIAPTNSEGQKNYINYFFSSSFLQKIVYTYWEILRRYFCIANDTTLSDCCEFTLSRLADGDIEGVKLNKTTNVLFYNSLDWINSVLESVNVNELKSQTKTIANIKNISFHKKYKYNIFEENTEIREYKNFLKDEYNNNRLYSLESSVNTYKIIFPRSRIRCLNRTNETMMLDKEINRLRRELNACLQKKESI